MSAVATMPPGPSKTCLVKFGYVSKAYLCVCMCCLNQMNHSVLALV